MPRSLVRLDGYEPPSATSHSAVKRQRHRPPSSLQLLLRRGPLVDELRMEGDTAPDPLVKMSCSDKTDEDVKDSTRGCICCKRHYGGRPSIFGDPLKRIAMSSADMDIDLDEKPPVSGEMGVGEVELDATQKLNPNMADHVAAFAKAKAGEISNHLTKRERRLRLAALAPYEWEEIRLGALLGVGGFSHVHAVRSFDISRGTGRVYNKEQQQAREFFSRHAVRGIGDEAASSIRAEEEAKSPTPTENVARYALKHLRHGLILQPQQFLKAAMDLAGEAEMLLSLDHPHIIKLRGWAALGPNAYTSGRHDAYFLITDRLTETLQERIRKWRKTFKQTTRKQKRNENVVHRWAQQYIRGKKEEDFQRVREKTTAKVDSLLLQRVLIAYQLSCALAYMHEQRLIYRDLKSSNVGFDIRGEVKMMDFGLCRYLPQSRGDPEETFKMSAVGTRRYMAPEVNEKKWYNLKADVYSYGVLMWEMMVMSSPPSRLTGDMTGPGPEKRKMKSCPCWPTKLQTVVSDSLLTDQRLRPSMRHVRDGLQEIMLGLTDEETGAELVRGGFTARRRSTFRLDISETDLSLIAYSSDEDEADSETSSSTESSDDYLNNKTI